MSFSRRGDASTGPGVLLEVGTNELEILVFFLEGNPYGINIAKVREILIAGRPRQLPRADPLLEGMLLLRKRALPLLQLRRCLGLPPYPPEVLENPQNTRVIVAEFGQREVAFRVDGVDQICRATWEQIEPLPALPDLARTAIGAVTRFPDRLVLMPDFEAIVKLFKDEGEAAAPAGKQNAGDPGLDLDRAGKHLVLVEDSRVAQMRARAALEARGYVDLRLFDNGKDAWDWLLTQTSLFDERPEIDILITDFEMPQIDGFHLTRLVRTHPTFRTLPVVLFSSLLRDDDRRRADAVGATAQVGKPEVTRLVDVVDGILYAAARTP